MSPLRTMSPEEFDRELAASALRHHGIFDGEPSIIPNASTVITHEAADGTPIGLGLLDHGPDELLEWHYLNLIARTPVLDHLEHDPRYVQWCIRRMYCIWVLSHVRHLVLHEAGAYFARNLAEAYAPCS